MANIYVNHIGSSTPPYDTEAKACTNIQTALDSAAAGDIVWIKADQNYVMNGTDQQTAQFDVDVNNDITIKGYYSTIGDQDYGGTYYKDPDHGWAVIDANNGAFNVFSAGDKDKLVFCNIKTINVDSFKASFSLIPTSLKFGYMVQNCWTTGGQKGIYIDNLYNSIIRDCKFTGTYSSLSTQGVIVIVSNCFYGGTIVESCEFAHGTAKRSIFFNGYFGIACNNIFNISGTTTSVIDVATGAMITNNVIYENSGGTITNGILFGAVAQGSMVFNNIIVDCTTSINDTATINLGGWNCFYNNSTDWTLRTGDIQADPQFMNAANGDFRLKPTSPCLNRGKPTWGGGYTSIGAWQRKSLLR
jgi:hypothetical protein